MTAEQTLHRKRDAKVQTHLEQYAPVWLVNEQILPDDEAIQFEVVFQHHEYGWVKRRYRYDGFNDVLYHKGQIALSEGDVAPILETNPYIAGVTANIPNAYGG